MGGNGKLRRWKISFHRSSTTTTKSAAESPPSEFICPISNSLMFDPVIVSSGQTFDRTSVHVCIDLGLTPTLPDETTPDFSTVIPNLALRTAIIHWCEKSGSCRPNPPIYSDMESIVSSSMTSFSSSSRHSSSRADTELNPKDLYSCSSSEESVIANTTPFLPFETRPSCLSYSSSTSNSSEFPPSCEDEEFLIKMNSLDIYEQEQSMILLRKTTRNDKDARINLCTERLLFSMKQLLISRYPAVQVNATASLVNLSIEKDNKINIVRAGIVPNLIEVLKNGFEESREHAAGAIFSLAVEEDNRTAIGVLGALQPLVLSLRSGTRRSRLDSSMALYHLTLVRSNKVKIVRLNAVSFLLGLLNDKEVAARVMLVVCNVAACEEGRAALLDSNAVECLVNVLRKRGELDFDSIVENCVVALHSLSHGSLRFKGLARVAGAAAVLREVAEMGSDRAREKAGKVLERLRGREEEEAAMADEEVDWEAAMKVVMKGGVDRARNQGGRRSHGRSSTGF